MGQKEGAGPLGAQFDYVARNDRMGQKSWELAESALQRTAIDLALQKGGLTRDRLDLILAGDLLNQCAGSFLASLHAGVPYLGQYGACSTMAQGLALGACLTASGAAQRLLAAASSHFCSAERQYRFPLAYGGQRAPTAQWTATAAGAAVLAAPGAAKSSPLRITHAVFGRMVELGVKDANNMGAAMAPAACDTLAALLADLGAQPRDFDRIVTGDLGRACCSPCCAGRGSTSLRCMRTAACCCSARGRIRTQAARAAAARRRCCAARCCGSCRQANAGGWCLRARAR